MNKTYDLDKVSKEVTVTTTEDTYKFIMTGETWMDLTQESVAEYVDNLKKVGKIHGEVVEVFGRKV